VEEKEGLIRFVGRAGALKVDYEQSLPGRGAYVHPKIECLGRKATPSLLVRKLKLGNKIEKEDFISILLEDTRNGQNDLGVRGRMLAQQINDAMPQKPQVGKGKVRL